MDPLDATLDAYEPRDPNEAGDVRRVRDLLTRPNPWSRTEPLHVTASALVLHAPTKRVLLRWHDRMQQWMQVGGHGDPGERDPWEVALREAREETGLQDLHALAPGEQGRAVQIVIVPVPAHGDEPAHEHADVRYLLATSEPDAIAGETPTAAMRWLSIDEAISDVDEDNLKSFLERARQALEGS